MHFKVSFFGGANGASLNHRKFAQIHDPTTEFPPKNKFQVLPSDLFGVF